MRVRKVEVIAPWDQKTGRGKLQSILEDVLSHDLGLLVAIEVRKVFVDDDRVSVHATLVVTEG